MSFYVAIVDEHGEFKQVQRHTHGGTYAMNGTTNAELNITYNYSQFYREVFGGEGLWDFNGKKVEDTLQKLFDGMLTLGINLYDGPNWNLKLEKILSGEIPEEYRKKFYELVDLDTLYDEQNKNFVQEGFDKGWLYNGGAYWKPTPGNAGFALSILLMWGVQHPDGFWKVYE